VGAHQVPGSNPQTQLEVQRHAWHLERSAATDEECAMTALTVLAVGDLILDEPDPASYFAPPGAHQR
jgi:hypothetical protein